MINLVYWSFALALVPFVFDMLSRASAGISNWIAVHVDPIPAAASTTCLNLRWTGQHYENHDCNRSAKISRTGFRR